MKKIKKITISSVTLILFQIAVVFVISGCSKSSGTKPGPNEVLIQSFAFDPGSLTVPVNTTVTWTNNDPTAHTVTSTTGAFSSGTINSGKTYTHQFTTAGTFPYACTIHPYMTGTIIVQ